MRQSWKEEKSWCSLDCSARIGSNQRHHHTDIYSLIGSCKSHFFTFSLVYLLRSYWHHKKSLEHSFFSLWKVRSHKASQSMLGKRAVRPSSTGENPFLIPFPCRVKCYWRSQFLSGFRCALKEITNRDGDRVESCISLFWYCCYGLHCPRE